MNRSTPTLADVVAKAGALPSAPWLLPKLMELLANADSAADHVETLIRMDAGLATGTLRLANSAYFTNAMPCDTLSDAIMRLGFREIYRLASTKIASGWLNAPVEGYGWEPGDLYRHSLTVAVAGDLLAKETGAVEPEIAYTAGLLHDIGKLALAYGCGPQFEAIRQYQSKEHCPWRAAEQQVLGFDHTDVSEMLLTTWKFPKSLQQVVKFYPRPSAGAPEYAMLVTHVHAAKHLALCLGTGVGEDGFQSEVEEDSLRSSGLDPEALERLLPAVHEISSKLLHSQAAA